MLKWTKTPPKEDGRYLHKYYKRSKFWKLFTVGKSFGQAEDFSSKSARKVPGYWAGPIEEPTDE